jgi:hypothetical protein
MNQPYTLFSALIAWFSISSALADSTDDALNQFYTENMMSRLTSEVSNALPESQKVTKLEKRAKAQKSGSAPDHSSRGMDGFSPIARRQQSQEKFMLSTLLAREVTQGKASSNTSKRNLPGTWLRTVSTVDSRNTVFPTAMWPIRLPVY